VALLLAMAAATAGARAQTGNDGSLEGKLTDLHSKPVGGARVVLRNARTGALAETVSGSNGAYRFARLAPGEYVLEAKSAALGQGRTGGIVVTAGHAARVQTAIALDGRRQAAGGRTRWVAGAANAAVRFYASPAISAKTATPGVVAVIERPAGPAGNEAAVAHPREPAILPSVAVVGWGAAAVPAAVIPAAIPAFANRPGAILAAAAGASLTAALQMETAAPLLATVAARAPDTVHPAVTTTLTAEQMQSLPLSGRHWENFSLDRPPEAPPADDIGGGSMREPAGAAVDGASMRLAFGGRGAGRASAASLMGPGASEAAIREMRAVDGTGASGAERAAGERTGVVTRGGADLRAGGWHGQAFVFDWQNLWGARNPFTQWVKETQPATATTVPVFAPLAWSPGDRRVTWGAGVGNALRRNRLFWFAAADTDARNDPAVAMVKHPENFFAQPSNDEMQVLSARLGMSSANPVAEGLAAYSGMLETLDGLLGPAARTSAQWTGFGRLDWNAAERHRFTLEVTGARWDSPGGGMTRASETYGSHSFGSSRASATWVLGRWEAFLTPNLLAVTQGSAGQQIVGLPAEAPSAFEKTLEANLWGQLPQMVVDSGYGFTIGNPARFGAGSYPDEHLYEAQENLDWVRGPLLIRAGFDVRHNADATSLLRNHTGTYHYARVENFASDALVFAKYGLSGALDPLNQHNCDQRGKAWRDTAGQLHGLGYLPCYSYYSQTLGPTEWHLETDDWAGFTTAQWEPAKQLVISAGLRWEREDAPPPIALVNNPALPLTQKLPRLGSEWAPRVSLAWGVRESHWPVLRLGYGMYYGRTENSVLETALTQTGSLKGDVNLFLRPTDNLAQEGGGAPPFPYVLAGEPGTIEKPGAVEMAPSFRNAEVHQGLAGVEEELPGHVLVSVNAEVSLGRRLPVTVDTNFDPERNPGTITYSVVDGTAKGPIRTARVTSPFFASWPGAGASGRLNPDYQQITELMSRANSTYEAATVRVSRTTQRGLSFHLRYAYAHAMDWNPNESAQVAGPSVLDPMDFRQEYGTSNLDVRHSASAFVIWEAPWKLKGAGGRLANGWMLSGIGEFHSGLPYTMRTAGTIAKEFDASGAAVVGLGPGMNGYGGDNRVYGVGRNTYRYPQTWKVDARLGRRFALGHQRELELLAESFNLFNHQNVTEIETVGYLVEPGTAAGSFPRLTFLTGQKTGQTEFGMPLNVNATDFYRERQIDFGLRLRFKHQVD
jgi:hypothetical protein